MYRRLYGAGTPKNTVSASIPSTAHPSR
jgi:hypothetical protein